MNEKLDLIEAFKANGLTTFQAMAAVLEDGDWDVVLAALEDRAERQGT